MMRDQERMRVSGLAGAVGIASLLLTGCMGPTYGTGTPADQQLLEDVTGVLALGGREREAVSYTARPELVRPASTTVLPTPQESSVGADPAWPESPEQRLARIRDEATANQGNVQYRSGVTTNRTRRGPIILSERDQFMQGTQSPGDREEFNRRLAMSRQGSPTERRYLSEPPTSYRQPAETAPAGDVGEEEWRKERRLQQETGQSRGWRDYIPGL